MRQRRMEDLRLWLLLVVGAGGVVLQLVDIAGSTHRLWVVSIGLLLTLLAASLFFLYRDAEQL
jgi:hypothetical protein